MSRKIAHMMTIDVTVYREIMSELNSCYSFAHMDTMEISMVRIRKDI